MAVRTLNGVIVPSISPMNKDKSLNYGELKEHLLWLGMQRVGLMMVGTTGEGTKLTRNEKMHTIEMGPSIASELVQRGLERPLLVTGTGTFDIKEAKFIARYAGMYGFEAIIALPPQTSNQEEIEKFYIELAGHLKSSIPESVRPDLWLYNIPSLTGIRIPYLTGTHIHPETVGRLVGMGVAKGLKDSGQDPALLLEWKKYNPKTEVIIGEDKLIYYAVSNLGIRAVAAVAGSGNLVPELVLEIMSQGVDSGKAQKALNGIVDDVLAKGNGIFSMALKELIRDDHRRIGSAASRMKED